MVIFMNSNSMKATRISIRELTELSILCALMFVLKEIMDIIPNVHPVALLIIFTGLHYGWKALYPVFGFVLLEIAVFGLGIWTAMYLYIWPLLVVIVMFFRGNKSTAFWAIIAGIFGLCFGALCSIPYIFISGIRSAVSFWIAGIPFDLIHGFSNFVIVLLVLPILETIYAKI